MLWLVHVCHLISTLIVILSLSLFIVFLLFPLPLLFQGYHNWWYFLLIYLKQFSIFTPSLLLLQVFPLVQQKTEFIDKSSIIIDILPTPVCCQPTELIWAFLFHKFSNFTPPPPHTGPVTSLVISPEETTIAVGHAEGGIALWQVGNVFWNQGNSCIWHKYKPTRCSYVIKLDQDLMVGFD